MEVTQARHNTVTVVWEENVGIVDWDKDSGEGRQADFKRLFRARCSGLCL